MASEQKKRLLFIELNEFNNQLLKDAAKEFNLPSIQRVLAMRHCKAFSTDSADGELLEPWVQWVSIHTGKDSSEHGIKHLGDVPHLGTPQIWELLEEKGISTGVWGVLNGSMGKPGPQKKFFFPDPWTFSEQAYPASLNRMLEFPRYLAKNRSNVSILTALRLAVSFCLELLEPRTFVEGLKNFPAFLKMFLKYPKAEFVGFCFAEYLMGIKFLNLWHKSGPQFGIFFVNGIAHLQHYYWQQDNLHSNERLRYGLTFVDKLFAKILKESGSDVEILVSNGLSQKNTSDEVPWVLYLHKNHAEFLDLVGVRYSRIEPLMSYDCIVEFADPSDCAAAASILAGVATLDGRPIFMVDTYADAPNRLFYRLVFTAEVDGTVLPCRSGNLEFDFFTHFRRIIRRTGRHVPVCDLYGTGELPRTPIQNTQIHGLIQSYFEA